jgi:hypothetical protein
MKVKIAMPVTQADFKNKLFIEVIARNMTARKLLFTVGAHEGFGERKKRGYGRSYRASWSVVKRRRKVTNFFRDRKEGRDC